MLKEAFQNLLFVGAGAGLKFEALDKALNSASQQKEQVVVEGEKKEEVKQVEEESEESASMGGLFD